MQIKKLSIFVMVLLVAAFVMIPFVSADDTTIEGNLGLAVETDVSPVEPDLYNVSGGANVAAVFSITENSGLYALQFDLAYDTEVFDVIGIREDGSVEALNVASVIADPFGNNAPSIKVDENGKIYVMVFFGKSKTAYTGDLFTINFRVLETAHREVKLSVSEVKAYVSNTMSVTLNNSKISISEATLLSHDLMEAETLEPTCTEAGYTVLKCSGCDFEKVYNDVEALGHDFAETVDEAYLKSAADCENAAVYYKSCTRCGLASDETFVDGEALGHDYDVVVTDPTCTEGGYTTKTCKRCGKVEKVDEKAALGHDEVVVPAVEATTSSTGLTEGKKCARCGAILVEQEVIPALDWSIWAQWWFWLIIAIVVIAIVACICVVVAKKKKAGKEA